MDVNNSLFNAVRDGKLNEVKDIVNKYGLAYSKAWALGYTLLRISTRNKHTEVSKYLLTKGAKANNKNKRKKLNDTPLHFAAMTGQNEIVNLLLDKGANIHAKNEHGGTPLQNAVYRKELETIEILINRGASVNDKKRDGSTPLHTAVERDCLEAIEILLKHGADVNVACSSIKKQGQTPLHFAAERGKDEIVELLLKNNALMTAKTKMGHTPIYFATIHGREKVVKQLLDHGANVNDQDVFGKTILYVAVEHGSLPMVEHILKYKPDLKNKMNNNSVNLAIQGAAAKYKTILDKLLQYGYTYNPDHKMLQTAVEKGYIQIVEQCLQSTKNAKHFLNNIPKKNFSLLHAAAKNNKYEIAEMLIKYGANVDALDKKTKTPLYYATENADLKMIKLLLGNGASVRKCTGLLINAVKKDCKETIELLLQQNVNINDADGSGRTALHFTALNELEGCLESIFSMELIGQLIKIHKIDSTKKGEITKILLANGANVNARDKDGRTTLHGACHKGLKDVVEILFEHNAKMTADETGTLPLHLAAYTGNIDILKMLINKGANVNAKTKDGMTAVHFAAHEAQTEFLEYLLKVGADVDSKDRSGTTSLHIAAKSDYLDLVELLLKYGADIDATDNHGRTALNIATKEGNDKIVMALLEYGCDIKAQTKKNFPPFNAAMMLGVGLFEDLYDPFASDDDDDDDDFFGSDYDCFDCDSDYGAYYGSDNDFYDSDGDYFDHIGRNIFSGHQISELLQRHVIMMKAAKLHVNEENLDSDNAYSCLSGYKTQCELEVEKLKLEKISSHCNVTFYDILTKTIDQVALYARNPKIVEALKSDKYKNKFPIYSGMINRNFVRGLDRKELIEQGNIFFSLVSGSISISLPYNCTENICSYLTDKDLRILIDASKPTN